MKARVLSWIGAEAALAGAAAMLRSMRVLRWLGSDFLRRARRPTCSWSSINDLVFWPVGQAGDGNDALRGSGEPRITIENGPLPGLIRLAMDATREADNPLYDRLPVPVRYRASGAIEAWKKVLEAAGPSGADFAQRLTVHPVSDLMKNFPRYLTEWARNNPSCIGDADNMGHAQRSVVMQAFSADQGALYEPTLGLHRLLDDAYIADDVPVGMIRLPVDTLCIVPDPSWSGRRNGIDAIMLFRRRVEVGGTRHESLSCMIWGYRGDRKDQRIELDLLEIPLSDAERTIKSVFDKMPDVPCASDVTTAVLVSGKRRYWEGVLDYAIKMLLYLTVCDAHVVHERAYTDASRDLGGLGKRRRAERQVEIEQLYDRYVVGPAILDVEAARTVPAHGEHREVRGHWRRPHFRMQPYGPKSSLRKLAFIGPTIVRPDRLGL